MYTQSKRVTYFQIFLTLFVNHLPITQPGFLSLEFKFLFHSESHSPQKKKIHHLCFPSLFLHFGIKVFL